jgi:hypothetical protein
MTSSRKKSLPQQGRRLRGKGDYTEEVKSILKPLPRLEAKIDHLERSLVHATPKVGKAASMAGRALGSLVGQGDLGAFAGESLAKLFGHGDYVVSSNSLMSGKVHGPNPPTFSKQGRRGTRIIEREFIGDVFSGALSSGSSVFTNTSYRLNPTDRSAFPWLSTIASQFDQWEPNGIVYEFVSTSSSFNGTSQALGTVIMATDYDVFDALYASKQVMENADYSCSTRPAESLMHGIECDKNERPTPLLYTSSSSTQNLQDLGNFQIATVGCNTAGARLGELWVSYDITFYKKQLVSPASSLSLWCASGTTTIGLSYFNAAVVSAARGITVTPLVGVGSRVNFPISQGSGRFLYTYYLHDYDTSDNPSPTVLTNCVQTSFSTTTVPNLDIMKTIVITLTGPEASFQVGLKLVDSSTYLASIVEVPSDYAFS